MRKVVITAALTGAGDTARANPAVPVTPAQIAAEAAAACDAGAAVAHIHVRDPATGAPSTELGLYREAVERVRASGSPVLINLTTGPGARFVPDPQDPSRGAPGTTLRAPEARVAHVLELRPDICSLDVGSFNFGAHVFVNTPDHLRRMAALVRQAGVKPEMEVFELGHVRLARRLVEEGLIDAPPLFQLCLGIPWGAPATPETMLAMRDQLPPGAVWGGFGIGRDQFPFAGLAAVLGGHVRVGLEDNLHLRRGELAPGNAALVERAVAIVRSLGFEVATPAEARGLLGLAPA